MDYEHINTLNLQSAQQLVSVNSTIIEDVQRLVNCIIKFKNYSIYVTSFDLFCYQQISNDDCAYGLSFIEVFKEPIAKLKS
jgi:hypothetical protein